MIDETVMEPVPAGALAQAVVDLRLKNPLVVALPPGGLLLARAISHLLDAPLDVLLMRAGESGPPRSAQPLLRDRSVVLVDDGQADASTWAAAISAMRSLCPARLIIATTASPALDDEPLAA